MTCILILEDNPDCLAIYQDILSPSHELCIVESLATLRSFLQNNDKKIDLLLADLKLPDGNFLNMVSSTNSSLMTDMSTIIVSSLADEEILSSCFEWGAVDYLIKPFRLNELNVKVNKALGHFKPRQSSDHDTFSDIMEELTSIEAKIFQQLVNRLNQYVIREQIMGQVWKKVMVNSKTLDVHLSNIRKKLSLTSWTIEFEDEKGWKLCSKKQEKANV